MRARRDRSISRFATASSRARVMASVLEEARSALRAFLRSASFNRTLVRRFVAMLASGKSILRCDSERNIRRRGAHRGQRARPGPAHGAGRVAEESPGFAPL